MNTTAEQSAFKSRVLETKLLKWKDFEFIQQEKFKDLSPSASDSLKMSILRNHFTQPFYVWFDVDSDTVFCIDGYHRVKILKQIEADGIDVPELLPATFIECADKTEAAKFVLVYSSIYAKVTETGFADFISLYDLNADMLKQEIDLPGIDFNLDLDLPFPDDLIGEPKEKPAALKITFDTPDQLESSKALIEALLQKEGINYLISVSCGEI